MLVNTLLNEETTTILKTCRIKKYFKITNYHLKSNIGYTKYFFFKRIIRRWNRFTTETFQKNLLNSTRREKINIGPYCEIISSTNWNKLLFSIDKWCLSKELCLKFIFISFIIFICLIYVCFNKSWGTFYYTRFRFINIFSF